MCRAQRGSGKGWTLGFPAQKESSLAWGAGSCLAHPLLNLPAQEPAPREPARPPGLTQTLTRCTAAHPFYLPATCPCWQGL